jgi:hypothetical protein
MTPYKWKPMWYHKNILKMEEYRMPVLKTQFTLRLDLVDHAKIKKISDEENRSMTNMIEMLIKKEIKRYESANGEIILTDDDITLK